MSGIAFVDSSVLIYAHDRDAGSKRELAGTLCSRLWSEQTGVLSIQVLQEFFVTVTRKLRTPIARAQAREVVLPTRRGCVSPTTPRNILRAASWSEAAESISGMALIVLPQSSRARKLSTVRT